MPLHVQLHVPNSCLRYLHLHIFKSCLTYSHLHVFNPCLTYLQKHIFIFNRPTAARIQFMFNISAFASFHVQHICNYTFSFKLCLTDLHLHVCMFNTSAIARCHVEHVFICTFSCLTYLDLNVFNSALTRFHG